jgi:hypothetical protein
MNEERGSGEAEKKPTHSRKDGHPLRADMFGLR